MSEPKVDSRKVEDDLEWLLENVIEMKEDAEGYARQKYQSIFASKIDVPQDTLIERIHQDYLHLAPGGVMLLVVDHWNINAKGINSGEKIKKGYI